MWDADGQRYVDFVLSWGPMILGHAHPEVVEAVQRQVSTGMSFGAPCALEADLAERIIALVPSIEMVRFCLKRNRSHDERGAPGTRGDGAREAPQVRRGAITGTVMPSWWPRAPASRRSGSRIPRGSRRGPPPIRSPRRTTTSVQWNGCSMHIARGSPR